MPQEAATTDLERRLAQALRELSEARDQQAATSDVLRIISSSPGELNPVFQAILANATSLCEAKFANLFLCEGDASASSQCTTPLLPMRRSDCANHCVTG